MRKKFIYVLWALLILGILSVAAVFTAIAKGWIGYVPPVEELENPNLKFATQIISDDGQLLGTWSYSKENRVYVGYNDLSPNLVHALVATEDVRFSEHSGIDARAFMRAVIKRGIFMQKHAGGGSTITQQLAKQFYSPVADNVMERLLQKPIEWVIAVKLERYYT
ncbi:transglycosylase domain-containing protein, partial [Phocaeicola coprocola]